MQHLDLQLRKWLTRLSEDVRLLPDQTQNVATLIEREVRALSDRQRRQVINASPVPLSARLDELVAFRSWTELANQASSPHVVRAHIVTQNYICFVYLKESCFEALRKVMQPKSVTKRCCQFLVSNPVRAFRNAVAHGNWTYNDEFSGIEFWSYKGEPTDEPIPHWEASQQDIDFWQALAKATAYSAFTALSERQK